MSDETRFSGFPKECVKFFRGLAAHNDKVWFNARRQDFENFALHPARAFVIALGEKIKKFAPGVIADPRVNQSLFRIYRDARFSKDKFPYKTHLGIWLWDGNRPRMENSGFYFHLEPPNIMIAAGMHIFPKPILDIYRQTVADPKEAAALDRAIKQVEKNDGFGTGGEFYKKVPRGFDPGQKHAKYLLYNGLWAAWESKIPDVFYTPEFVDFCADKFRKMAPLHKWLTAMLAHVPLESLEDAGMRLR